jgi:glyoxylase-like metal-dependent hydrolase (beta-lactamase superfamily II)
MAICGHKQSGGFDVWVLSAGHVRMDGGAMFGVVPRPLWEKSLQPDDLNRIGLAMNCMLVRGGGEVILIETGFGGKVTEKLREIYALDESDGLLTSLDELGIAREEITRVVLTHLHQDHAGGCTVLDGENYVPTFPNASYYIQRGEWDDAMQADGQTIKGFRQKEVMLPLAQVGAVTWLDGDGPVCEGIEVIVTPGHTRMHQTVLVKTGEETFCFVGDTIPTTHHLKPICVMAYDLYPRETYVVKQQIMARAFAEKWVMVWPHEPDIAWGYLGRDPEGAFTVVPL